MRPRPSMRASRGFLRVLALAALAGVQVWSAGLQAPAQAPAAPGAQQTPQVGRVRRQVVLVNVVFSVLDRKNRFVTDLGREDFEVFWASTNRAANSRHRRRKLTASTRSFAPSSFSTWTSMGKPWQSQPGMNGARKPAMVFDLTTMSLRILFRAWTRWMSPVG